MTGQLTRRDFTKLTAIGLGLAAARVGTAQDRHDFQVALDERSLKRMLHTGQIDHLDVAGIAKTEFGITAVEYASSFFSSPPQDHKYLAEMNQRAAAHDVRQLLIVVDSETPLGDAAASLATVTQPYRNWIDAAKVLGCHSIGVPITAAGNIEEALGRCAASISLLCEYANLKKINVVVGHDLETAEDVLFLTALLERVKEPSCGTMLGFHALMRDEATKNITKLIPRAKAICATAKDFNEHGEETTCDYRRALATVIEAGYRGYIGVYYQGETVDDIAGVKAVQDLLRKSRAARS